MHGREPIDKHRISHLVIIGDSLSDRGTLDKRRLFGLIPMAWLSGLAGKSPSGRFTNGYAWSDYICATLTDQFDIRSAEQHGFGHNHAVLDTADQADAILVHENQRSEQHREFERIESVDIADAIILNRGFGKKIENSYTLDNDLYVQYQGRDFVRCYDEGGLTSHDYSWWPSSSLSRFFSRLILCNLGDKREVLLAYDKTHELTHEQKCKTLVIEWSGANDLITVNSRPSRAEADRAIRDRITNVRKLIEKGYRHFTLIGLPDLSLTPRYQNKQGAEGVSERLNAHQVCDYFNQTLQKVCAALQHEFCGCVINVFDVNKVFSEVYQDTKEQTHQFPGDFEAEKLNVPYTQSLDFKIVKGLSPAKGYMFWDDVHPTADMHALLAEQFYAACQEKYVFTQPNESAHSLCESFKTRYNKHAVKELNGLFGGMRHPKLLNLNYSDPAAAVTHILRHALYEGGTRTRDLIKRLGWIDANLKINTKIPALKAAKEALEAEFGSEAQPLFRCK